MRDVRILFVACSVFVRSVKTRNFSIENRIMAANFQEILDSLPEKPARSRLEPYHDLIEELLNRGRSYREIRQILAEKCGLRVALSTLHGFMGPQIRPPDVASQSRPLMKLEKAAPSGKESTDGNTNQGHINEVRQRIEALKRRKPTERKTEGFSYDPDQPLRLLRNSRKGISGE